MAYFAVFSNVNLGSATSAITGLIVFLVLLIVKPLYYTTFEHVVQRTPGKYLTKSLVIDEYGNKPPCAPSYFGTAFGGCPSKCFPALATAAGTIPGQKPGCLPTRKTKRCNWCWPKNAPNTVEPARSLTKPENPAHCLSAAW